MQMLNLEVTIWDCRIYVINAKMCVCFKLVLLVQCGFTILYSYLNVSVCYTVFGLEAFL